MRWGCVVWAVCTESFHMIYPRVHRSSGWVDEWVVGWVGRWVQCSACVTGKSSDPKINWLENNVSCIYWFMFILTCDQDIATAFGLSCSWFSWFSFTPNSWLLTHIVFRPVSAIVPRSMGRDWFGFVGCCFQFGFRSVHFSIYLLWLFAHHYAAPPLRGGLSVWVDFMQNPYSIWQLNICANIKYWLQIRALNHWPLLLEPWFPWFPLGIGFGL